MKIAIYENTGGRCCEKCHTGQADNADYRCNCPCHSEKPVYIGTGEDFVEAFKGSIIVWDDGPGRAKEIVVQLFRDFLSTFKKEAACTDNMACRASTHVRFCPAPRQSMSKKEADNDLNV